MTTIVHVIPKSYHDSMKLMRVSAEIKAETSVTSAFAFMGTEMNKSNRVSKSLITDEVREAGPDDLILAVEGEGEESLQKALVLFIQKITQKTQAAGSDWNAPVHPKSLEKGIIQAGKANLAIISVPGTYAAAEAFKALHSGLHVMIFSDNVSVEDELALKTLGREKGLLVMGPDCGTAIINGTPLCFANKIPKGPIGIVGASGTGTQQVTVNIARLGAGITHAIGTGGRDLKNSIMGISSIMALQALAEDKETEVIVLVSKPAEPEAEKAVMEEIRKITKPVVVAFLGKKAPGREGNIHFAEDLEEAAAKAVAILRGENPEKKTTAFPTDKIPDITAEYARKDPKQKYIRGIFTGGTLADEAMQVLREYVGDVYSNIPLKSDMALPSVWESKGHTVIDVGDDVFTRGRLHPMIDPSYRSERVMQEYADPEASIILCDVVIGYGAHPDPATLLAEAVKGAQEKQKRNVTVVAFVCGTDQDPQSLSRQEEILTAAGIVVCPTGRYAAEVAGRIASANTR